MLKSIFREIYFIAYQHNKHLVPIVPKTDRDELRRTTKNIKELPQKTSMMFINYKIINTRPGQAKKTHADSLLKTENKIVNLQVKKNKYDNKSKTIYKMGWG